MKDVRTFILEMQVNEENDFLQVFDEIGYFFMEDLFEPYDNANKLLNDAPFIIKTYYGDLIPEDRIKQFIVDNIQVVEYWNGQPCGADNIKMDNKGNLFSKF